MKIIAKTSSGYLVEATAMELAAAAGYRHPNQTPGWKPVQYEAWNGSFPIGLEIKPSDALKYLNDLRDAEAKVKESEAQLRALANILHAALPTTMIVDTSNDPDFKEVSS
jgi:hypothetical protein